MLCLGILFLRARLNAAHEMFLVHSPASEVSDVWYCMIDNGFVRISDRSGKLRQPAFALAFMLDV